MADRLELQEAFGQPGNQKKGCGFPVAHFLALFHADTGFVQRIIPSPLRTHDMANAADMHPEMREGDILIADRGFASFAFGPDFSAKSPRHLPLPSAPNRQLSPRPQTPNRR